MPRPEHLHPEIMSRSAAEAAMIVERLLKCTVGEVVSYKELTRLIGRDVQDKGRVALLRAQRDLWRGEAKAVFGTVMRVGVKRLSDDEIAKLGPAAIRRIHKLAQRVDEKMACVQDVAKLSADTRTALISGQSFLRAIAQAATLPHLKQVAELVEDSSKPLPMGRVLEVLKQ